ncbi:PHP domain-containing protein [Clostridium sp. SHJSY1]|uniref:PHP domain-containing protein n=1 Tax=Clostridium sp. SHJSY1 TaxID=2942483 RepID=UPI0028747650|nr:PHP domain-containing protein [Clostridium sp. SHJSY1]MDS0525741.1 PHP domain-containing protein [Clostridium sp. SHJSY1]
MILVDFHNHTTFSDGILSPRQMVNRAFKNGVKFLAITDHDTIGGLKEATNEALNLGITLIPGIELSTTHNHESIHLLGFFRGERYKDNNFIDILNNMQNHRIIRAKKMVEKLKEKFNIEISFENVLHRGKEVVARPHIADEIISAGYPYDKDYIFDNFIGKDCPAFVPTTKMSTEEGVKLLKKYNAMVFLAHPILIKNSPLTDFLNIGLDGIEAIYFQNSEEDEKKLLNFADENELLVSAGSDCHGDIENDKRHGDIGSMHVPNELLRKFLSSYNGD